MKRILAAGLILFSLSCTKKSEPVKDDIRASIRYSAYLFEASEYIRKAQASRTPEGRARITKVQAQDLANSILRGCGGDIEQAVVAVAIGKHESHYFFYRDLKRGESSKGIPRTDAMGAHYNVIGSVLKQIGVVEKWDPKSTAWKEYRQRLKKDPAFGTMISAMWFSALARKYGTVTAIKVWQTGKSNAADNDYFRSVVIEADALLSKINSWRPK